MQLILLLVTIIVLNGINSSPLTKQDAYKLMIEGLQEYKTTGQKPSYLKSAAKKYNTPNYFSAPTGTFDDHEVCTTCNLIVDLVLDQRARGMNDKDVEKDILFFCKLYMDVTDRVCEGLAELNAPTILYIMDHTPNLKGRDVCAIALQFNNCAEGKQFDWTIDIPSGTTVNKPQSNGANSFGVLHITDIHYDPRYTANKTNDCGEPVCCQNDQANGTTAENSCGYWSDYNNADIPWRTVENALEQTKNHEYEYVYFTGDIIPHRTWNTSILDNIQLIAQILDSLALHYKVPVYVTLGNHEVHPCNLYSELKNSSLSATWLFDILFQKLSKWIPMAEVKDTILKGGYYTVTPRKGLRIIVLNNNVCNANNWWLVYNPRDPYDQLQWLAEILLKAEQNNERVHLLHHIPTGEDECYRIWAREYRKLIDRFANTIAAQFNGHTHRDQFYVYYNRSNSSQAVNMAWNGASIVTYDMANPSYKVLSIDDQTFSLLDFEEWTYNLTLANLNGGQSPIWYKLYSFKDAYGAKSLEAEDINELVLSMTKNHKFIDQYYRYKFRNGDLAVNAGCDDDCKKALLCSMVKTEYGDNEVCNKVKELYDNEGDIQLLLV